MAFSLPAALRIYLCKLPCEPELRELRALVVTDRDSQAYVMFNIVWMKDDAARFLALRDPAVNPNAVQTSG